ncbi:uncharacterized protein LOC142172648 [Nicotiana tabacum]|uniref:Uncharacterized protein LOC142172648 n=1 Tax=Nicotiana tabacum TaxID=4097 RepID=A0AC58T5A5_TOBAC
MVQQLTLRLFHTESHVEFVLTLIYAKCDAIERIELWDSLYAMARDMDAPWLVGGDFNVIWDEEEKFGSIFTWWNGRAEEDCIFKRLDRCLANLQFQQTFPGIEVQHLSKTGSDHSPMYLKCDIETPPIKKPFKFLNFWVEHATFKDVVKENWTADFSANPYIFFNHKLKKLKKAFSLWSKATFGDIFQKIASMEEGKATKGSGRIDQMSCTRGEILATKGRHDLVQGRDRNTKFFHAQVRGRRKRLQLNRIQNSGGTWIGEEQEITEEAIKFYEEQFTEATTPSSFDIVENVPNLINTKQNAKLIKQPTKEEVKVAVLGLNGDSAGGPYVSNNWYSILINGQAHGFFKFSRGVKQGDPVSPTLFILAAETLSRGLNALHTNLYFYGFGMPKWSPKINHLAYADDMIIFSSSDETSLMLIMQVLNAYEAASGQLVNKTKSTMYLHHLTDMEVVSKVERITGIHRNDFPIIYLGCPIFYARRKLEYYQPLITKAMDKLQSWQGGTSRHWASWNTLCMPVEEGGISFRSLHDVAKALFNKLWWNFRTKPSLWSSFVCQKYCLGALYFLVPQDFGIDETVHNVHDVTLDGEWDVDRLFEMLPKDLAVHILEKIKPPSPQQVLDMPCWMLETRGHFSVKSAWDYTRRRDEPRTTYRMIWVKGLPFKIAFFMWKVWKAKLPLYDFLKRVGYYMPSKCWCCVQPGEESLQHLFFRSKTARTFWKYFLSTAGIAVEGLTLHQAITKCWTANVYLRLKPVMQALPSCVVWELWKRRNSMKYGDAVTTSRVIYQVSSNLQALMKVRKPGMDMVPHKWQDLLAMMENFTPKLKVTKVMWEFPSAGWLKVNTDGASRGNPGRSSIGFCIRNENGDIVKSVGKEIEETTNIVAEAKAMVEALRCHYEYIILCFQKAKN